MDRTTAASVLFALLVFNTIAHVSAFFCGYYIAEYVYWYRNGKRNNFNYDWRRYGARTRFELSLAVFLTSSAVYWTLKDFLS